jgi:hypothetical protein
VIGVNLANAHTIAIAPLTNKGTVSENRSSAAGPASMETIAAQRRRQRGLLSAGAESAAKPAIVNVNTAVVRSATPSFRTTAFHVGRSASGPRRRAVPDESRATSVGRNEKKARHSIRTVVYVSRHCATISVEIEMPCGSCVLISFLWTLWQVLRHKLKN